MGVIAFIALIGCSSEPRNAYTDKVRFGPLSREKRYELPVTWARVGSNEMRKETPEETLARIHEEVRRIRESDVEDKDEVLFQYMEATSEEAYGALLRTEAGKRLVESDIFQEWLKKVKPAERKELRKPKKAKKDLSRLAIQEMFNLDEVALICSVSKRTVEDAVAKGALSSVKEFGGLRVTRAQLETFIRSLEIQAGFKRPKGF